MPPPGSNNNKNLGGLYGPGSTGSTHSTNSTLLRGSTHSTNSRLEQSFAVTDLVSPSLAQLGQLAPRDNVTDSPTSPQRGNRSTRARPPGGTAQPALPKIPRGSIRRNVEGSPNIKVMNVKQLGTGGGRSNSNSPSPVNQRRMRNRPTGGAGPPAPPNNNNNNFNGNDVGSGSASSLRSGTANQDVAATTNMRTNNNRNNNNNNNNNRTNNTDTTTAAIRAKAGAILAAQLSTGGGDDNSLFTTNTRGTRGGDDNSLFTTNTRGTRSTNSTGGDTDDDDTIGSATVGTVGTVGTMGTAITTASDAEAKARLRARIRAQAGALMLQKKTNNNDGTGSSVGSSRSPVRSNNNSITARRNRMLQNASYRSSRSNRDPLLDSSQATLHHANNSYADNNNNNNYYNNTNPPSLLPSISSGGETLGTDVGTIATADVFLDEDGDDDDDYNHRRRRTIETSNKSSKMRQQQQQQQHQQMGLDSSHGSNPPQKPNRRLSSTSAISGITEDVTLRLNDMDDSEPEQKPLLQQQQQQQRQQDRAQEQAVALANDMFNRSYKYDFTNEDDDDDHGGDDRRNNDDSRSLSSDGMRSLRSMNSHRSRRHLDPELDFLHSSVIEDAMVSKGLSYGGVVDEAMVLDSIGQNEKSNSREGCCSSRSSGLFLCGLVLFFWGGVIPYCIIRHEKDRTEPPTVVLTEPPTRLWNPWTPTAAPVVDKFTLTPTLQPLVTVLTQAPVTTTISPQNETESPSSQEEVTSAPVVNQTQTLAPSPANITTTLTPTIMYNTTTNVPATPSPTTAMPTNSTTSLPTIMNNITTNAPTGFTPATRSPTRSPTTPPTTPPTSNNVTMFPNTTTTTLSPSNFTLFGNETENITTIPTPAPTESVPTISASPTSTPSLAPTEQPEVVFPNYTLRAFNNPGSPQSKAFSWMLRDPNFGNYSPNRMRQRFALAVLFYATNGDDWIIQTQPISNNFQSGNGNNTPTDTSANTADAPEGRGGLVPWLSYQSHECDWYHRKLEDEDDAGTNNAGGGGGGGNAILQLYSSNLMGVVVCENEYQSDGIFRAYRALWLEKAGLRGTLPPELSMLTGLRELQLSNNEIFRNVPAEWFWDDKETPITWQTSLEQLVLQNNTLSGSLPSEIGLAASLKRMDLQQNRFQRRIPSEIGLLGNLTHLLWNDNSLTGLIPTQIGEMSSMTACSWTNNRLSGPIPSEIGQAIALREFYVGENRLTGPIPWRLMFLRDSLVDLHLYSNQLSQSIPTRLGLLTKLRWFHAADNLLTGNIPPSLGGMKMMQLFQVDNNELEGELPSEALSAWDIVSRVWLHNNTKLYGSIPPAWCPGGALAAVASELTNLTSTGSETNVNGTFDVDSLIGNETILQAADTVEFPKEQSERSVDIRVDCNNVTCPCLIGCHCQARRELWEGQPGVRGGLTKDTKMWRMGSILKGCNG